MKELNANDMNQVSGGVGESRDFKCEKCGQKFRTNAGTQYHGVCLWCTWNNFTHKYEEGYVSPYANGFAEKKE